MIQINANRAELYKPFITKKAFTFDNKLMLLSRKICDGTKGVQIFIYEYIHVSLMLTVHIWSQSFVNIVDSTLQIHLVYMQYISFIQMPENCGAFIHRGIPWAYQQPSNAKHCSPKVPTHFNFILLILQILTENYIIPHALSRTCKAL